MFERFTDRARRVVVLAQEEARLLDHDYIGTEHILLGLVHEAEGVAARALESLGIGLEAVRAEVEEIIGRGASAPSGHVPFTPRAKKVLELSLREALQLGHNYIGTEHVLLGLLREGEGVAAQVLVKLGADLSKTRQEVIELLSGYGESNVEVGTGRILRGGETYEPGAGRARQAEVRIVRRLVAEGSGPFPRALEAHEVDPEAFLVTLDRLINDDIGDEVQALLRRLLGDETSRLARALREHDIEAEEFLATIEEMAEADRPGDDERDSEDIDIVEPPTD